jgi:Leucine Rich repeat
MGRHPAAFAPTAAEVLSPQTNPSRTRPALADFGARDLVARDGAVVALSLTGRSFVAHSDALFAVAPELVEVRFVAVRHILGEFVRCANLARLRTIDLAGNRVGPTGAETLAACEFFHALDVLDLTANSVGDDGGRALLAAPWADSIRELRLSGGEFSDDGVRALRGRFGNRLLLA